MFGIDAHDFGEEAGGVHPGRFENVLVHILFEGHPGDLRHQRRQNRIVGVHILKLGTRGEGLGILLFLQNPQQMLVIHERRPAIDRVFELEIFGDAGGVGQQVPDGDTAIGKIREIERDGVFQVDFPLCAELQHRHRGELLGDGGQVEEGGFGYAVVLGNIAARRLTGQAEFPVGILDQHGVAHCHEHHPIEFFGHLVGHKFQPLNVVTVADGVQQVLPVALFREKSRVGVRLEIHDEAHKHGYREQKLL